MMLEKLAALIESALSQLPAGVQPKRIVLGYSGGLDSELLACAMAQFHQANQTAGGSIDCLLVHVHHGLSANADSWAAHCRERAAAYGLPFTLEKVAVKQGARLSLEAEARNARYRALCGHLQGGDVLLTAHHQDDQLETVLLALTRGLGPKGLAAMGVCQPLGLDRDQAECTEDKQRSAFQLRPFLALSRAELEKAAEALGLVHIEDESNRDSRFDRNYLRLEVIPRLTARWGAIAATASRSARLCAETQSLVEEEARQRLAPLVSECPFSRSPRLDLAPLAAMTSAWQAQLLRCFLLDRQLAPPSEVQLGEALTQLLSAREDAAIEMQFGDTRIRRYQGWLYADVAVKKPAAEPIESISLGELKEGIATPLGRVRLVTADITQEADRAQAMIAPSALEGSLSIAYGLPGSRKAKPTGRSHSRELKKLWQEQGVPTWLRGQVPMLMREGKLVAALGVWIETDAKAKPGEAGLSVSLTSL